MEKSAKREKEKAPNKTNKKHGIAAQRLAKNKDKEGKLIATQLLVVLTKKKENVSHAVRGYVPRRPSRPQLTC